MRECPGRPLLADDHKTTLAVSGSRRQETDIQITAVRIGAGPGVERHPFVGVADCRHVHLRIPEACVPLEERRRVEFARSRSPGVLGVVEVLRVRRPDLRAAAHVPGVLLEFDRGGCLWGGMMWTLCAPFRSFS